MNDRTQGASRPIQLLVLLLLMLVSGIASALGLGEIRVLSRPGEPLVAEIAVISADPAELEQLRVSLASPSAFTRVGLEPPAGVVSELQFELARNAQGRAVVRVTSHTPVETPSLSFLIMADWAQGRLLREYSVLIDAPDRAVAISEPLIEAPAANQDNLIQRGPQPIDEAVAGGPSSVPASTPSAATSRAAAARPQAASAAPRAPGEALAPVREGQTLSQIAGALARESGGSLEETMVALLRANPDAFIRGNMHLLKQGAVLRTPPAEELARLDAAQARAIVREQTAQWRQARAPIQQPAAGAAAPVAAAAGAAAGPADTTQARLEIASSLADGEGAAGMKTGTSVNGEGDILANQQLQQAREDIATRDAEIQELRERVADLEKLQKQQQALISMKDSDMAAAQQRLEQPNSKEAGGSGMVWLGLLVLVAAAVAWFVAARRRRPSPLPPLSRDGFDAAALAAAMPTAGAAIDTADAPDLDARDRARREEAARGEALEPPFVHGNGWHEESLEDADVDVRHPAPVAGQGWQDHALADAPTAPAFVLEDDPRSRVDGTVFDWPAHETPDVVMDAPDDAGVSAAVHAPAPPAGAGAVQAFPPQEHAVAEPFFPEPVIQQPVIQQGSTQEHALQQPAVETVIAPTGTAWPPTGAGAGRERLELAIAYLDLGDAETARTLLQEVAAGNDPQSRDQALELLSRL